MQKKLKITSNCISEEEWSAKSSLFLDNNLYQTLAYQRNRINKTKDVLNSVEISDDRGVRLLALTRIINIPLLRIRIGYIQWGPLLRKDDRIHQIDIDALSALRAYYIPGKVDVLRINPNIYTFEVGESYEQDLSLAGFRKNKYKNVYHTILFPLDIDQDEMRLKAKKKWRAALRNAEKKGLLVSESENIELLVIFSKMYKNLQRRKCFTGLDINQFIKTQEELMCRCKLNMVLVNKDSDVLSVDVNSYLGDTALGLFQSTTPEGLKLGASYLAWWHTFLAAKRAGMRRYDMGGVDPVGNPDVYHFKLRIGGDEAHHLGCFDAYSGDWAELLCPILDFFHSLSRRYKLISWR